MRRRATLPLGVDVGAARTRVAHAELDERGKPALDRGRVAPDGRRRRICDRGGARRAADARTAVRARVACAGLRRAQRRAAGDERARARARRPLRGAALRRFPGRRRRGARRPRTRGALRRGRRAPSRARARRRDGTSRRTAADRGRRCGVRALAHVPARGSRGRRRSARHAARDSARDGSRSCASSARAARRCHRRSPRRSASTPSRRKTANVRSGSAARPSTRATRMIDAIASALVAHRASSAADVASVVLAGNGARLRRIRRRARARDRDPGRARRDRGRARARLPARRRTRRFARLGARGRARAVAGRVTRFNYLASWTERCTGSALAPDTIRALRGPAAALACAVAFAGVLRAIELRTARCRDASRRPACERALAALQPSLDAVRALERDVASPAAASGGARRDAPYGRRRRERDRARREPLPDDAWLAAVRVEPAQLALDGRARTVDAVAEALRALGAGRPGRLARLISARGDAGGEIVYALTVDRAP